MSQRCHINEAQYNLESDEPQYSFCYINQRAERNGLLLKSPLSQKTEIFITNAVTAANVAELLISCWIQNLTADP